MSKKYFYFHHNLYGSRAYFALTGMSPHVLNLFMGRQKVKNLGTKNNPNWVCLNNGELVLTYKDAQDNYGLTERRFTRAIDQLIEVGFLDITVPGIAGVKMPTKYALSNRWKKYGTDQFEKRRRLPGLKVGKCDPARRKPRLHIC